MVKTIARHEIAINRPELSRPIKLALADGILSQDGSFFDYGCGRGDDLRLLEALGIDGHGWDPFHRPEGTLRSSSVINIGYVVNVIEDSQERQDALRQAWTLAETVLIVSARLNAEARSLRDANQFADGCLTGRGTFQKFFDQQELRNWIDQTLGVASVPAAPGAFYVFRDEQVRASFIASRYRRRLAAPRLTKSAVLYQEHADLLQPLLDFVGERGRLPRDAELVNAPAVCEVFGSIRRAFQVIKRVTDTSEWETITEQRSRDLMIYLALSRFDGRPNYSRLPTSLQGDVKAFFSNYKRACKEADELLYSIGQPGVIEMACQVSKIGKLTPQALYVHESALDSLSPILRLFEGCARGYIGRVEGANIIKLNRHEPKISYLSYPDFETDPHPALAFSLNVHLQTFRDKFRDFRASENPPILHRKEAFVSDEHPLYEKFARLTRLEEHKGLYEDTSRIGTRDGWNELLAAKSLYLSVCPMTS